MKYEGAIIRPPREAHSQLIQVSVGYYHNGCTFCPAYKEKKSGLKYLTKSGKISRILHQTGIFTRNVNTE